MTNEQAYLSMRTALRQADIPDAGFEAGLLLEHVTGHSRFEAHTLTGDEMALLDALTQRRLVREPLQYLLGSWPFMGLELAVGPGVLIPRADTECVCEAAIQAVETVEGPVVLDLCSGTGALALGISAAKPDAIVTAVELYDEAFAYLQRNTSGTAVHAVQADALCYHEALASQSLDLLVCNPPYVTQAEYETLEAELFHEPKTALVAGDEGLLFYKQIACRYKAVLKPGGTLVFEIGSGQGAAVATVLREEGYHNIQIRQDYAGLDRTAIATKG